MDEGWTTVGSPKPRSEGAIRGFCASWISPGHAARQGSAVMPGGLWQGFVGYQGPIGPDGQHGLAARVGPLGSAWLDGARQGLSKTQGVSWQDHVVQGTDGARAGHSTWQRM